MPLSHSRRLASHYVGSKGRKVTWTEGWEREDVFIPKYRPDDQPIQTPKKSKYHDQIREYQKRLQGGEEYIEIPCENPPHLRETLSRNAKQIAPELKFIAHKKDKKITILKRKVPHL